MTLALVNYFVFEKKGYFSYRHVLAGMIFPGLYWTVFVNIGDRINFFPYFFMSPNEVGWLMVFVWFGALLLTFVGLGLLLMLYDRRRAKIAVRFEDILAKDGLTLADIDAMEDVEIE